MSDLRERFERHQAGLLNIDYEELRDQFDRHEEIFGKRYVPFSDFEKEFELWQACWNHQQAIIDQLKAQLNNMEACYIEKKKQVEDQYKKIDELQKENAALVHVIKSRDIQLENEKHEYDELVNKLVDSKMKNTKLQKRVDAALEITKQGIRKQGGDYYLEKLEQALNGGNE